MALKTSQVVDMTGIPRHKLYYLEQKGYVSPERIPMGDMECREYSDTDVEKIHLIWKYLKKGFKHKIAYKKAMEELDGSLTPLT
ncbi:MAG: MerR family transcriptional regulator [Thermodesulfobacteriota bacterium]